MKSKYWRRALTAAAFALVASGCAGNSDPGAGVASLSDSNQPPASQQAVDGRTDEDTLREFAKCMREHGVNIPDPAPGEGGIKLEDTDPQSEKVQDAREACRHLLPNGGNPQEMDPERLDKARERAKCMREHGIDVPDPDPNNPGVRVPEGVDREKAKAAREACRTPGGPERTRTNG